MPTHVPDHNASYSDVSAAFVAESRQNLVAAYARIEHCLNQLTDEQLWWRPQPAMNSIANLLLHLGGNIGQWISCAVYNLPSKRNRAEEFSERGPIPKQVLQEGFKQIFDSAIHALDSVKTAEQLLALRQVKGDDTAVLTAIYRAVAHFEGHTQEIIAMTRQLRGEQYQFLGTPKPPGQTSA